MAAGDGSSEPGNEEKPQNETRMLGEPTKAESTADESEDDEEDEEEEEPQLKYATLTKSVSPIYRNGDATSTFLVAGDKMASRFRPL